MSFSLPLPPITPRLAPVTPRAPPSTARTKMPVVAPSPLQGGYKVLTNPIIPPAETQASTVLIKRPFIPKLPPLIGHKVAQLKQSLKQDTPVFTHEEVADIDAHFKESAFPPEKSFFKNCDLEIYPDTYDPLPDNGIKRSDFDKLEKIVDNIDKDKGNLVVENHDEHFCESVKSLLKDLALMKTGRTLLLGLLQKKMVIFITKGSECEITFLEKSNFFELSFSLEPSKAPKSKAEITTLGGLYHELSHALIEPMERWTTSTTTYKPLEGEQKAKFQIDEERRNILGAPAALANDPIIQKNLDGFVREQETRQMKKLKEIVGKTSAVFSEFHQGISQEWEDATKKAVSERELKEKIEWDKLPQTTEEDLSAEFEAYDKSPGGEIVTFENRFNVEQDKSAKSHKNILRLDHNDPWEGVVPPPNLRVTTPNMSDEQRDYFLEICKKGFVDEIREFFAVNTDLVGTDTIKNVLNLALDDIFTNKNIVGLKAIVEAGALPIDYQVKMKQTSTGTSQNLFQLAASTGFLKGMKYLLTQPNAISLINKTTPNGDTLIHIAISKDDIDEELINFLLWCGIDPNQKNKEGISSVEAANLQRHFEILPLITSRKNLSPSEAATDLIKPSNLVITSKKMTSQLFTYLVRISKGGRLSELKELYAINKGLSDTTYLSKSVMKLILENNKGNVKGLQELIESGILSLDTKIDSKNLLQFFIENGSVNEVEFLLSLPACKKMLTEVDSNGNNLLHTAMRMDDQYENERNKIIELLASHSVSTSQKNNAGSTPIKMAVEKNLKEILPALIKKTGPSAYMDAFVTAINAANAANLGCIKLFLNVDNGLTKELLEQATHYAIATADTNTILTFFNFILKYDKTVFLSKENTNNLLHNLLVNNNAKLDIEWKAKFALQLIKSGMESKPTKVYLSKEENSDGETFTESCPTDLMDKILELKKRP